MRGIARLNDVTFGTCYHKDHPPDGVKVRGKIISASGSVFVNGRGAARKDDVVLTSCGHYDYILDPGTTVFADKRKIAVLNTPIGKNEIYIAQIISASGDTNTA